MKKGTRVEYLGDSTKSLDSMWRAPGQGVVEREGADHWLYIKLDDGRMLSRSKHYLLGLLRELPSATIAIAPLPETAKKASDYSYESLWSRTVSLAYENGFDLEPYNDQKLACADAIFDFLSKKLRGEV